MLEQFANPEYMIGVAYRDTAPKAIGAHDDRHAAGRLGGVAALHFGDHSAFRHSMTDQIIAAHPTFAEARVSSGTTSRNHYLRHPAVEQVEGMVESRPQHRRRVP